MLCSDRSRPLQRLLRHIRRESIVNLFPSLQFTAQSADGGSSLPRIRCSFKLSAAFLLDLDALRMVLATPSLPENGPIGSAFSNGFR
jgi:hypothetical protein